MAVSIPRPPVTIRLPQSLTAVLHANKLPQQATKNAPAQSSPLASASTSNDERAHDDPTSEVDSLPQAASGLSASSSTMSSSMITVDTADTDIQIHLAKPAQSSDLDAAEAAKQKKRTKLAEKRRRKKEADRHAKLTTSQLAKEVESDIESSDGRDKTAKAFLQRHSSGSSSPDEDEQLQTPALSSTPAFVAGQLDWAEDVQNADDLEHFDFRTLNSPSDAFQVKAQPNKPARLWPQDAATWRPALQRDTSSSKGSQSRRESLQDDSGRASPSAGWQEVSSKAHCARLHPVVANLRPGNAFVGPRSTVSEEPAWKHDKFEDPKQAKTAPELSRPAQSPAKEMPWTVQYTLPALFNEPGSRVSLDESKSRKRMTLRISLKPVSDIHTATSKFMARQRAGVVEIECFLKLDGHWPRKTHTPMSDDSTFIIHLSLRQPAVTVRTPAAEAKHRTALAQEALRAHQQAEQAELECQQIEEAADARAQAEAHDIQTSLARSASHDSHTRAPDSRSQQVSGTVTPIDVLQPTPIYPSMHGSDGTPLDSPAAAFDFPSPAQPFVGADGMPFILDPATGQYVPYGYPPFPLPSPAYFMDGSGYPVPPPQVEQATPLSFFAPPKSHRLEIKAPTAETSKHTRRQSSVSSTTTSRKRAAQPTPVEPDAIPEEGMIPGSFVHNGAVFFAPPPMFQPPMFFQQDFPPAQPISEFQDPAILHVGNRSTQSHTIATDG